jgi:hypothetical protein
MARTPVGFRVSRRVSTLAALVLAWGAGPVLAEGLLAPFLGVTFGGDAPQNQTTFGISLTGMGGGGVGFELDFGRTPEVFGSKDQRGENDLITITGNVLLALPLGVVRPYVAGGAGLFRSHIEGRGSTGDHTGTDLGIDVGAGLMGFLGDHVGARVDVRVFRNVTRGDEGLLGFELGDLDVWRAAVGVVWRF